ncbi:hypothetical protein Btru_066051 [Bulinus truncatus]|nr:hypothetical protein Btru_066051 [Bulinus truncatus]
MSNNRERRSVSLGRHRDRGSRDTSKQPQPEDDWSTRHNISNFLLTLQRVQASEEENRNLRKENQILRQRNRNSRLSSSSFRGHNSSDTSIEQTLLPDDEDQVIAANVKRNSLMFVGDQVPTTPEHAALEVQYKKLQQDFETVKEFLKHLFQHALTMSSDGRSNLKDDTDKVDINTYNPGQSKQLEQSLYDIHGQINQIRNSQDRQQIKMEQVQQALDNVLCQSSVRNDVTMRIVRQQDKLKEITKHSNYLETQLMSTTISLRQAEEKIRQTALLGQALEALVGTNAKNLKGNTKDELNKLIGIESGVVAGIMGSPKCIEPGLVASIMGSPECIEPGVGASIMGSPECIEPGLVASIMGSPECIEPGVVASITGSPECIEPGVVASIMGSPECIEPGLVASIIGSPEGIEPGVVAIIT